MAPLAWLASLALAGCTPKATLPPGSWTIQGHGVRGGLEVQGGTINVQLQGEAWSTETSGAQAAYSQDEQGQSWLYFPVQTAAGAAEAAMQIELEQGAALLPLGFRDGEHLYTLGLQPGQAPPLVPLVGLDSLQQAWQQGGFTLWDGASQLAGRIALEPGARAQVQLITATALTDGPVAALRKSEGPDQLLAFPVEPRFADESGLLRLNIPTMKAVLPVDRQPHAGDRWLTATPGMPDEAAVDRRIAEVRDEALKNERALLTRFGLELSGAAQVLRQAEGRCPTTAELQPDWKLLLEDYRLSVQETPGDCLVRLEPHLVQHTRRTAITASAQGLLEVEVLGAH